MTKPEKIELTQEELDALLERVESNTLEPEDYATIKAMADTISFLSSAVDQKGLQLKRLLRSLFGSSSEKREDLLDLDSSDAPAKSRTSEADDEAAESTGGHGRRPASEYTGADIEAIEHEELEPGDDCPELRCKGKVYAQSAPKTLVRVRGQAPLTAKIYELERYRCNLCGKVFSAAAPEGIGDSKYDETVASAIALLKYGSGVPFYRLEKLQESLGIPLPASTQWDIIESAEKLIAPVYDRLFREAAEGDLLFHDDTSVKVLELMGKRLAKLDVKPDRKGLFTTGIVSQSSERMIALYFSGSKHAGENLSKLLSLRTGQDPPIQMSDGLNANKVEPGKTVVAHCLTHGRRQFVDVFESFPEAVQRVVDDLAHVYKVDKQAREEKLNPAERLALHQRESGPVLDELKEWLDAQLSEKIVEENSGLGKAILYVTKRWDSLTLFLRKAGAPLDNNISERALKKAILNRKNSLFFKTRKGAKVGDRFLSLIQTCELSKVNPFEYLNALQRHAPVVGKAPEEWLPWNYSQALAKLEG